ncbi:MAG: gliding motility-associated protein GldM [Flavobacteriales bacterium]|jgi:gliding motility-associated protein GldM
MGGGKETPRQKLIGLMYLVLMALLAMNTSKEVILAFITLNDKFQTNMDIVSNGTENKMGSFETKIVSLSANGGSPEEIATLKDLQSQSIRVRDWTRNLSNEFVSLTSNMIKESGDGGLGVLHEGDPPGDKHYSIEMEGENEVYRLMTLTHLTKKDDYDTPSRLFIGMDADPKNPVGGYILDSIKDYRDRLCELVANHKGEKEDVEFSLKIPDDIALDDESDEAKLKLKSELQAAMSNVDPKDTSLIVEIFNVLTYPELTKNHGEDYPYVSKMFDHAPLVAAAAMFTSMRGDLVTAENKVITHLEKRVQVQTFNFNKIEPLAFAKKSLVPSGDTVGIKVMIAAYDSTEPMKLKYWMDDSLKTPENMKEFEAKAGNELKIPGDVGGKHTVYGEIAVKEKGAVKWKNWKYDYFVTTGAASATVSAFDLNVFYTGWSNRVKVSAGGVPSGSVVSASCSGCTSFTKSGEFYIAKVNKVGGTAKVSVTAKDTEGNSISLGAPAEFRIFPLPKPQPYYAGKSIETATMSAALAKKGPPLKAKLPNSPLNVPYTVTGFQMVVIKGGKAAVLTSKSDKLTSTMKDAVKTMGKGQTLTFTQIKAAGPSGKSTIIGNLTFNLK